MNPLLIDINGVLYVGKEPVTGAVGVINLLRDKGYKFRFISNATQSCRRTLSKKLAAMGFDIRQEELFTAPIAAVRYVKRSGKNRCFLLSKGDLYLDFTEAGIELTEKDPDFVVVGDAGENFTFEWMNLAFNLLLEGASLIAMEEDRYWDSGSGLSLCAGPYVKALEYASGKRAFLVGKPSQEFFSLALRDMKAKPEETTLIGDDIFTDIIGAQRAGMKAFLVKTGKYQREEVEKSEVKPDHILESIANLRGIL